MTILYQLKFPSRAECLDQVLIGNLLFLTIVAQHDSSSLKFCVNCVVVYADIDSTLSQTNSLGQQA